MIVRAPCGAIVRASVIALVASAGCLMPQAGQPVPATHTPDADPTAAHSAIRIGVEIDGSTRGDATLASEGPSSADWRPLGDALANRLGRPVQIAPLASPELKDRLRDGRVQFGLVSARRPQDPTRKTGVLVAVGLGASQVRRGLIVAAASSPVYALSDLVGQRFAFGPAGDPVFDRGAVEALEKSGVPVDSLKKEMIPIPGGRQFHETTRGAARAIVYDFGTYAGVIDEAEYLAMNDMGGRFLPGVFTFSKDQFRILGRTQTLPSYPVARLRFVAATQTDAALIRTVRSFLLSADETHPSAVAALGINRFVSVASTEDDVERRLVGQRARK